MKNLITFILLSLTLCSFGQRKGKATYMDADTIKGVDTVYLSLPKLTGYYTLSWELYFEQIGGTSDGIGILQASNDVNYVTINDNDPALFSTPNDTITITDGLIHNYVFYVVPFVNYRIRLIGTSGDTTKVTSNYVVK